MIELYPILKKTSFPQIKVVDKIFGELISVSSKESSSLYKTELKNKMGKTLGSELFTLDKDSDKSTGLYLSVKDEYRNKGFRFGEILRLSSIIMILENKIREFKICSKNSAIFFHSKYKFNPNITKPEDRNKFLENIIKNCKTDYEEITTEAEILYQKAKLEENSIKQEEITTETNLLLKKYVQKILETKNEYKSHQFDTSLDMILTIDDIKENKEFFNNLFKTHNIDYKI